MVLWKIFFSGKQKSSRQDHGFYCCQDKKVRIIGFLPVYGCPDIGSEHLFIFFIIAGVAEMGITLALPIQNHRASSRCLFTGPDPKQAAISLSENI